MDAAARGARPGPSPVQRATIAERFFRPANRLESIRDDARTSTDAKALQRINDFEWTIADARAFAPDDFPYLETRALTPSPTAELKRAVGLQKAGNSIEAEHVLQSGKETYSFGHCDFSTGLAIVYYTTNRKDLALQELDDAGNGEDNGNDPQEKVHGGSIPSVTTVHSSGWA